MLQLAWKKPVEGSPPSPIATLFEQHNGMVFRTAYRITGSAADAEDVLQTVFLRMLRRDSAEPLAQAESYFRRAAINVSLDLLRERTSQSARASEAPTPTPASDPEWRLVLRQSLSQLDPKHAEMFSLRYFEGYSNGDIAAITGSSSLLVAVTLHRVRAKLQKFLNL